MRKLNCRAGTPIDVMILVFIALGLSAGALYVFYTNSNYVSSKIVDSRFLDTVYIKESQINFYIDEAMERSLVKIIDKQSPVPEFIDNFKQELEKYKINEIYIVPQLAQIENQINEENIKFIDGKIIFSFSVNIQQDFNGKFVVNYNYNKVFEKKII